MEGDEPDSSVMLSVLCVILVGGGRLFVVPSSSSSSSCDLLSASLVFL